MDHLKIILYYTWVRKNEYHILIKFSRHFFVDTYSINIYLCAATTLHSSINIKSSISSLEAIVFDYPGPLLRSISDQQPYTMWPRIILSYVYGKREVREPDPDMVLVYRFKTLLDDHEMCFPVIRCRIPSSTLLFNLS